MGRGIFQSLNESEEWESEPPSARFEILFANGVKELLTGLLKTVRRLVVAEGISDLVEYRKA